MVCKNCGSYNDDSSKFCIGCGNVLNEQQNAYGQDSYNQENFNQGYSNPNDIYTPPVYRGDYNQYPPVNQGNATVPGKGLAIAGMVCGIVSIVLCSLFIPAILGIIFGGVAKSQGYKGGEATAGIVCGVVSLALIVVYLIVVLSVGMSTDYYFDLYSL